MPRLRRADPASPGITRKGRGRGFEFFDPTGTKIEDLEVIARCKALVIPPAWQEVWICPDPNGHLQAVGTDAAGRRQYRYHDEWRRRRDAEKFDRMLEFAQTLPALRAVCKGHLEGAEEVTRERVLACSVRLLDHGFFRVGGAPRSAEVESFGLTTIRKDHVTVGGGRVEFAYPAKGGIDRVAALVDPEVLDVVGTLRRRRTGGEELLAWKEGGEWVDVDAKNVNAYLKIHAGEAFSAKDFRTWHATVLAAVGVAAGAGAETTRDRKANEVRATKEVAEYLGNTPAVARDSYIDPRVFDRYRTGWHIGAVTTQLEVHIEPGQPAVHGDVERAVIDLLTDPESADTITEGPLV